MSKKHGLSAVIVSKRIAEDLRREILDGQLGPGDRIRQEEIAELYRVSRLPVREALRMLESDGLVKLVAHTGAWVNQLNMKECIELYKIRERLEPLLIAESISGISDGDVDYLEGLAREMEVVIQEDIEEFLRLDRAFHLQSYKGATTEALSAMVEKLWNTTQHYRRAYTRTIKDDRKWVLFYEHRLIVDAIRTRNVPEAENIVENHIRKTRMALSDHPEIFDL